MKVFKFSKFYLILGAIWHALNHYQFDDALFMSERLIAESQNQEEVFLLATCHYRMGNKWAAKEVLEKYGNESSQCRFLYTRFRKFSGNSSYLYLG